LRVPVIEGEWYKFDWSNKWIQTGGTASAAIKVSFLKSDLTVIGTAGGESDLPTSQTSWQPTAFSTFLVPTNAVWGDFSFYLKLHSTGTAEILFDALAVSKMIQSTSLVQDTDAWIPPTLLNSWVNFGGASVNAAYYRQLLPGMDPPNYRVYLRGLVKSGVAQTIFTLPTGYRPSGDLFFGTESGSAYGRIKIDSAGNVAQDVGATTDVSLSGITFDTR